ncbi:midasin-like [Argonauta hians]
MAPVQQVPLEVQLAQGLAGNEPASRDKTFETLRKFVRLQLPHLDEPLTNNDFIKIWKGIHYRLWMQDKPLLQEKLVDQICQLLPLFPSEEYAMMYIRSFYETEAREWNGIDQLRLDKYMMLVREFVNSVFVFLCKSGWKKDLIKQVNVILEETVFNFDSVMQPHSLQLHLIDIYPLELMKVVDDQFSPDIATSIFSVFIHVFPVVRNVSVINKLFTLLQNTIFEEMSPGDRTKKKRKVLNGIQERDVTHFENHVKLAVDRKQFLSLLLDTASNERGSFKRRNQLYNLIKRIKSVELNKSSEKGGGGGEEEEKPKKKKKSKKAKVAAIRDVDVEDAALELKKFEEKLSEDIPSQKRLKRIQRKQERLEKKLKKKAAKDNEEEAEDDEGEEEEAEDDEGEEEEEEVVAAEFIQFEADEEGDSDGEWIDDDDDDDDGDDDDDDDDYDMFNDEDLDDSFIVDDDDEEEEDGSEEEEEVEGVADEDDSEEEEEVVTPRKKQKTSHVKKGSVLNNVISDDDEEEEEEDYGYDEENEEEEEEGSDDGLEYDVEEAFLNLEMDSEEEEGDDVDDGDDDDGEEEAEGEKEDKSQSNNEEDYDDDDDDVGCYVVDVSTDTCGDDDDDDGDDDEDQNIQSKPTKKQTVCDKKKTKKKKKSVDVSKTESEASSSSKRKCSEEEEDSEDTIEKRMKMMVDMMMMESDNETKEDVEETKGDVEETKTKQKRKKKKKNKNKKTGKVESKKTGAGAASNNMFTLVDFEEETEEETENKSLLVEKKAATNGENTDETSTKPKKKQKKKKQQEKELTSTSTFPLPAGLESSPKVQEVVHQLKSIMNEKQMRRTEGADKKMKKKLNRYFDMVSKNNLLNEVSSDVPNGNTDQSGIDFVQDGINGLDQVSKDKKKSKKRKRKPDQQKENLAKFCESPPAFFQVAVSKVKKATKQKNRTPKSIPESYGVSLDRKSVSFDMKQNKAFLPETPISSESPYNSQKKPKTGILKPSPSPILVRKQKKKKKTTMQIMKRPKASDFF